MPEHDISRRNFAAAFLGGAAGLAAGSAASTGDTKDAAPADVSSVPPVELLIELIRRTDPDHLKQEHLEQLRGDLEVNLQRSARLSAFMLTNADEPAPIFTAWRSEG